MKVVIGVWLMYEAIIFLVCWIMDELGMILPFSIFFAMICGGAYLLTP